MRWRCKANKLDQGDGGGLQEGEVEDPLHIPQDLQEREQIQVLGVNHISEDLPWAHKSPTLRKARQCLYHFKQLRILKISGALQ